MPPEGREVGVLVQGAPGSGSLGVAFELSELPPPEGLGLFCLLDRRRELGDPNPPFPDWTPVVSVQWRHQVAEAVGRAERDWFTVHCYRPRDQVQARLEADETLLRRSYDWTESRMKTWDAVQAEKVDWNFHLLLNLGDGFHTPDTAAQAVLRGLTEFWSAISRSE